MLELGSVAALRITLQKVVEASGLDSDNPTLVELKRIILGRIAELEATAVAAAEEPRRDSALDPAFNPEFGTPDITPLIAESASQFSVSPDPVETDEQIS